MIPEDVEMGKTGKRGAQRLTWDIRSAATRARIEEQAAEDAWGHVAAEWKRGFPRDLRVLARELAGQWLLRTEIHVAPFPVALPPEIDDARHYDEYNAIRGLYYEHVYTFLVEAIRDRIRAEGQLPRVRRQVRKRG